MHLKIQYCGGWNYRPYVDRLRAELDKDEWFSTAIQYHLFKDDGMTGNFEVNAYTKYDLSDEPKLIFSKQ